MVSTVEQPPHTDVDLLLRRMLDKIVAFQALLLEEQSAIRSLSFGQFTSVTMHKTQLLDEIRDLEQQRRNGPSVTMSQTSPGPIKEREAQLAAAIVATDQLNRLNGALIAQSLEFLQGTLRLWQRSPASAALYSSTGAAVAHTSGMVRVKG